ncbi:O-antigen ligase family protein [Haloarchaeobius sp. HRN-SO-5]|uniref:O-antigen ligase family protein n=1 Tax=Haloarchaeobius sp. HRN-SO-5 TaxID=3446118 RepID=UPI003EBAE3F5
MIPVERIRLGAKQIWSTREAVPSMGRLEVLLLGAITLLFPFHSSVELFVTTVNGSLADSLVGVTVLLVLLGVVRVRTVHVSFVPAIAFVTLAAVGIGGRVLIATPDYYVATTAVVETVKLVATLAWMVAIYSLLLRDTSRRLTVVTIITAVLAGAYGFWSFYLVRELGVWRPSGPFQNPNLFADYLLLAIFLSLALLTRTVRSNDTRMTVALTISILGAFLGLVSTASRSGFGALLVGLVVVVDWKRVAHRIRTDVRVALGSVVAIPAVLFVFLTADFKIVQRFADALSGEHIGSRPEVWRRSFEVFLDSPVLGIGIGQFRYVVTSSHPLPHNTSVLILTETGLIGVAFAAMFVLTLLRASHRLSETYPSMRMFTGFFVATLVNSMFHDIYNFRSLWIAAGIVAAASVSYPNVKSTAIDDLSLPLSWQRSTSRE